MRPTVISLVVAGAFLPAGAALAQMNVSGYVSGDLLSTEIKGEATQSNPFVFDKYKDMRSGATVNTDIRGEGPGYHLRFFSENIGRDDMFLELSGGRYGLFKYSVYRDDVIHHLTHNAITPYSGVGTNTLTLTLPVPTTAAWNRFDYEIKHENTGGTFEWKPAPSPFYVRATFNQKETNGVRPNGNLTGNSPGGPSIELPMVVNFTTTDASAEAGYATKASLYSVNLSWSRFRAHDEFMNWRNPILTAGVTNVQTTIAPDNNLWKIGGNAVWKQLPMASSLALRGTYARLTNDQTILPTGTAVAGTTGQLVNMNPNTPNFNGKNIYKTFSASLTSNPMRALDSRVYFNWTKKDNESTHVTFRPVNAVTGLTTQNCDLNLTTGVAGATCSNELFHYRKANAGIDLQYRLSAQNRIAGGWDYTDTKRERIDVDRNKENKVYVELKNNTLEAVTAKVKYQHLRRRGDFQLGGLNPAGGTGTSGVNNLFFLKEQKRFDVADLDQDLFKLALDSSPWQHVDLGAELIYKNNKYKDTTIGRQKDNRRELYLTAAAGDPKGFRVNAFFDYEKTYYDSKHWVGNVNPATFPAAISGTQYLWEGKVKDDNWVIGLGADWRATARLMFKGSLTWQKTDGTVGLASNTALAPLQNVTNYDSFRRDTLNLRAIYAFSKQFEGTLGWAYDRFQYSDIQMDGYQYITPATAAASGRTYFSGAYAFPDYRAQTVYATLKYNFQ